MMTTSERYYPTQNPAFTKSVKVFVSNIDGLSYSELAKMTLKVTIYIVDAMHFNNNRFSETEYAIQRLPPDLL